MRQVLVALQTAVMLGAGVLLGGCAGGGGKVSSGGPPGGGGTPSTANVLTYHYDNQRTGQNLNETTLTSTNVNSKTFGKLGAFVVDGLVDAQPLYVSGVLLSGGTKNVVYVATEHGSVYAFDADSASGNTSAFLWRVSLLGSGETTSDDRGCSQVTPEIGITSTPVIDTTRGAHGAIYVVAMSKDSSGNYFQRLHALDLATGAELFGGPRTVQASYPGTGDNSSNGTSSSTPSNTWSGRACCKSAEQFTQRGEAIATTSRTPRG